MFYQYFWLMSWVYNIFGVVKPLVSNDGIPRAANRWLKMWSLLTVIAFIISYIMTTDSITFSLKTNLEQISDCNDLATNVGVILINLFDGDSICLTLYETVDELFKKNEIVRKVIKLFALKIYFWCFMPTLAYVILIILEFVNNQPPFVLLIRIPTILSMLHLFIHLQFILALLKVVNKKISKPLECYNKTTRLNEEWSIENILAYLLSPDVGFIEINENYHLDLRHVCDIYDELTTINQLLEKHHGFQMLLIIWQMFSCAVAGVTLIACDQSKIKWLVIVKTILPFVWIFIVCYVEEQLQKEVADTNTLLIKRLIDYRCDPARKVTLETFKQLVSTNQLQFTACSLFSLSYTMILGTVLNVITYSIILIQLFLSE